jgi:hypothetical protein
MSRFVGVAICAAGAGTLYGTGHPILFWLAVVTAAISFWTLGVMHNYAMNSAKLRNDRLAENMTAEGRRREEVARVKSRTIVIGPGDLDAVPNGLALVDMVATVAGVALLGCGLVIRLT